MRMSKNHSKKFQNQLLIAHNCSQALARDIFTDMLLRVEAAGYPVILHIHDELIVEVPKEIAEKAKIDIDKIRAWKESVVAKLTGGLAAMSR